MDPEEVIRLYCRPSQEHLQLVNMKLEIQRRTFYLLSLAGHKRSRVEEAEQRSRVIREVNACSEAYDEYLKMISRKTGCEMTRTYETCTSTTCTRTSTRFVYHRSLDGKEITHKEYEKLYLSTMLNN